MSVLNGVDVLLENPKKYLGDNQVGLITNPTGITTRLESTLDAFHRHEKIKIKAVFGPEHGARGDAQDALDVSSHIDSYTGLPVYSLYGEHRAPTVEMLDGIDILLFAESVSRAEWHLSAGEVVKIINRFIAARPSVGEFAARERRSRTPFEPQPVAGGAFPVINSLSSGGLGVGVNPALLGRLLS